MTRHDHDRYDTPQDLANALTAHLLRNSRPDAIIEPYCGAAPFLRAARWPNDRRPAGYSPHGITIDIASDQPCHSDEHYRGDFRELCASIPIPDSARSVAILANPPYRGSGREGVGEHLRALYTCAMDLRHGHKVDVRLGALVPITALAGTARRALWRDIGDCYLTVYVLTPRPSFDGEGGVAHAEYVWIEWSEADFKDCPQIEWLEWKD